RPGKIFRPLELAADREQPDPAGFDLERFVVAQIELAEGSSVFLRLRRTLATLETALGGSVVDGAGEPPRLGAGHWETQCLRPRVLEDCHRLKSANAGCHLRNLLHPHNLQNLA